MEKLEYLKRVESKARTYATSIPRLFTHAKGVRIRDSDGQEYIDCLSNAGTLALGHNHPEVNEAVMRFLSSDQMQQALDLGTPAKHAFVEQLFSLLPAALAKTGKIQFCSPSGADGVEAALKLTRHHTGRSTVMAFHGAYHGMTAGALAVTGKLTPKPAGANGQDVHFLPFPYAFRCPFGTDGSATDQLSINYIRTVLSDPESGIPKPAAVIVEVVQGEGGCIPASDAWLIELRELTLRHEIPLIVDEVQTGLGRTGAMFAIEHSGIRPDVLVLSKAFGGGYPLSVVVYDERLDTWPAGAHAGTFRGNQIAMVAGLTTMQIVERDGLSAHAGRVGKLLLAGLEALAQRFACLGQIRGRGLMIGAEVVAPGSDGRAGPADGALAKTIKQNCLRNGLVIETGGRNGAVLRFLPPLILSEPDAHEVLNRFEHAVETACRA
ncbi:diaminobutyrate--2-oxoglutarate transaminase family protein [Burkholderia vietnamiensis]|jgi:diaminobutyrate-2-oxoglutarate transaminase|uniref:diaminobutyrate--2-oxoglutarate transaminase family protein n=1 Tax=Burkholderia vietnamiensis TaxID=60552 RepID=UPI001041503B|nr:diaminobutyrate--2-oxoglutarate transaminase family protein [Burkholderia vietnamiensis]UEB98811.1 diaminobutyrate--2-oxoglutarate transaminase family protein [Burkholderia vietnamiensis]HEF4835945.1 diaminobutyrate--2-oxoglutarate transaminase family protein [Burkholderia vietnamiensis]